MDTDGVDKECFRTKLEVGKRVCSYGKYPVSMISGTEGSKTNQKLLLTTQLHCLNTAIKERENFCAMRFKENEL